MKSRILQLQKDYPLPKEWGQLNIFSDQLSIGDLHLKMVGLSLDNQSEIQATGSAVDAKDYPWERAYFELIERGLLLNFEKKSKLEQNISDTYPIFNINGSKVATIHSYSRSCFNHENNCQNWRHSLSNGVAVQLTKSAAIQSAGWELIERDRILRYWYSRRTPLKIPNWKSNLAKEILELYDIDAYSFHEDGDNENEISVVGIFGFPKNDSEAPLIMGFGANQKIELSIQKAIGELYQRLAFLWGEEKLRELPAVQPNAGFHLEYYHCPKSWDYLKDWLNYKLEPALLSFKQVNWKDIFFIQMPIIEQHSPIQMIKAISNNHIPLTFGNYNPKIFNFHENLKPQEAQARIHPIA